MTRFLPAAIGFALMVAYWPEWSGLATTPRWDVGVVMAAALVFTAAGRMSAARWLGLALVAWLVASLAWSPGQAYGIDTAAKLLVVVVAFAWGVTLRDSVPFIAGAAAGVAISSLVAIAQWYGWTGIESATGSPAGLFWNGNRLAEVATIVLAACLARGLWWALPGLVPALILPYARGAWLTAAIVVAVSAWRAASTFSRFVLCMIAIWAVALSAMLGTIWRTQRYGLDALAERLAIWDYTVSNLTWLGHGLGSFAASAPLMSWGNDAAITIHPHNEFLWIAFEGGAVAAVLAVGFAVAVWRANPDGLRLVVVAFGAECLFAMPVHDPASVLFCAVVAGHLVGAGERVRVAADSSRDPLREGRGVYGDRTEPRRTHARPRELPV